MVFQIDALNSICTEGDHLVTQYRGIRGFQFTDRFFLFYERREKVLWKSEKEIKCLWCSKGSVDGLG